LSVFWKETLGHCDRVSATDYLKRATILDLVVYVLAYGGFRKGCRIVVRFMTRYEWDGEAPKNAGSLRMLVARLSMRLEARVRKPVQWGDYLALFISSPRLDVSEGTT
jgi:hypothetical protein